MGLGYSLGHSMFTHLPTEKIDKLAIKNTINKGRGWGTSCVESCHRLVGRRTKKGIKRKNQGYAYAVKDILQIK
jgi:hypothetical protein